MKFYNASHPGMSAVRRRSVSVIGWVIFVVAALIFAFAAWQVFGIVYEDAAAGTTTNVMQSFTSGNPDAYLGMNEIQATAVPGSPEADGGNPEDAAPPDPETVQVMDEAALNAAEDGSFTVDFNGLLARAKDTKAWIRVPGTNISHPVVQGKDNEKYLNYSPDGSSNRSGSIFMDYRCQGDFNGRNTILYGHRMNNNTMFAQLHKYEDASFRRSHPYIYINLPDGTVLTYRVFAVYAPGNLLSGHPYQIAWMSDEDFMDWCAEERKGTYYFDSTQQFTPQDRILTLSTCVKGDGSKRFIVQGRLISHTTSDDGAPGAE